jgi:hypothetical protein
MNRFMIVTAALAIGAAAAAGCKGKGAGAGAAAGPAAPGAPPPPAHASGTPHTDAAIDAWKSAGLAPEGFAVVQPVPYGAAYCEEGRVQGIDALVCEYGDDGSVDRAQKLIHDQWEREGVHTGVALRTKRTLLAVVDRGHHDPNGKMINQLLGAFRKL